jgi:beta-N-acetylhexosaminidase
MVAHICLPNVTKDNTPASLSKIIIADKLQNELGYDGIVITDALNMGAITQYGTSDKVALEAIKAGNDIILMPYDYKRAFDAVAAAVESGDIPVSRIERSVKKILLVKNKFAE